MLYVKTIPFVLICHQLIFNKINYRPLVVCKYYKVNRRDMAKN